MHQLLTLSLRGVRDCLRIVVYVAFCLLALLGGLAVVDAFRKPNLPALRPLTAQDRADLGYWAKPAEYIGWSNDAERWQRCQPSLALLDRACPEISAWVRSEYDGGRLLFVRAQPTYYAAFNPALRILMISDIGLGESDAELACTLAHEFRHSRQPLLLVVQVAIAGVFGVNRREMTEEEAYAFEARVRRALRGER